MVPKPMYGPKHMVILGSKARDEILSIKPSKLSRERSLNVVVQGNIT